MRRQGCRWRLLLTAVPPVGERSWPSLHQLWDGLALALDREKQWLLAGRYRFHSSCRLSAAVRDLCSVPSVPARAQLLWSWGQTPKFLAGLGDVHHSVGNLRMNFPLQRPALHRLRSVAIQAAGHRQSQGGYIASVFQSLKKACFRRRLCCVQRQSTSACASAIRRLRRLLDGRI
jgi:hypothetical protein